VLLNSEVGYLTVCCSILILISQSFILTAKVAQLESASESFCAENELESELQALTNEATLRSQSAKKNAEAINANSPSHGTPGYAGQTQSSAQKAGLKYSNTENVTPRRSVRMPKGVNRYSYTK
jgi:hypothetical protein